MIVVVLASSNQAPRRAMRMGSADQDVALWGRSTTLAQAASPGLEVLAALQRDPQGELQALLDLLEPVGG